MGMRLLFCLVVVLVLPPVLVRGQIEEGFNPFEDTIDLEAEEKAKASAAAEKQARAQAKADPSYPTLRLWKEAISQANKELAQDDVEIRERIEAEIPRAMARRDSYEYGYARRWDNDVNPYKVRRSIPDRAGDKAVMQQLENELYGLSNKIKSLDANRKWNRVPLAWKNLSDQERAQILKARVLTPHEKSVLDVKDERPPCTGIHFLNSVGMQLIEIPAGGYQVSLSDGKTKKEIVIAEPFWMGETEVTEEQYAKLRQLKEHKFRPSTGFKGSIITPDRDRPVTVNWVEAVRYCIELSEQSAEKNERRYYRLPSEAEWEYACRAGTTTDFSYGDLNRGVTKFNNANIDSDSTSYYGQGEQYVYKREPVGYYPPNPFGLYDMHGNLAEWCSDWYDSKYYDVCPRENPPGPKGPNVTSMSRTGRQISLPQVSGKSHRGGWYDAKEKASTSSFRADAYIADNEPPARFGFRVVCEVGEPSEITRRQYAEFAEFDANSGLPLYKKALENAIDVLRDRWKVLNSDQVPAGEEWLIEVRKRIELRAIYTCEIFEKLAWVYTRLDKPEMAHKAYLEVLKQRRAFIDLMRNDPDVKQYPHGFDNQGLAFDYFNVNDIEKSIAYAEFALEEKKRYDRIAELQDKIRMVRELKAKK